MPISVAELEARLTARDEMTPVIDRAGQAVATAGRDSAASLTAIGGAAAGAGAILGLAMGSMVSAAGDFDQALANIKAVGGADAAAAMGDIRAKALQLGADTKYSAQEAAAGMEELIKAGMPVKAVLAGGADGALALSAAAGVEVPEAATLMANAINVFGDSMAKVGYGGRQFTDATSQATHVADLFAGAANASAADAHGLGYSLAAVGLVASQANQTIEQTVGALAAMADAGLQGSDAGTSLKTMLMSLMAPTDKAQAIMDNYGISVRDANGNMKSLTDIAGTLQSSLAGLDAATRDDIMKKLFGTDGIRAANVLLNEGAAGLSGYVGEVSKAGSAAEASAARMDSFQGAMETLRGSIDTVRIAIGSYLVEALRPLVERATDVVNGFMKLPPVFQKFIAFAGGIGAVALTAGGSFLLFGTQVAKLAAPLREVLSAGRLVAAVFSPLGLVLAAVGLAVAAYKTNFMGFADWVDNAAEQVRAFAETFQRFFLHGFSTKGSNPVVSFLKGVASALDRMTGIPFRSWLNAGIRAFQDFSEWVGAAFERLRIGETLGRIGGDVARAVGAIRGGDWAGAFSAVSDAAGAALAALGRMFGPMVEDIKRALAAHWPGVRDWIVGTGLPMVAAAVGGAAGLLARNVPGWVAAISASLQSAWPGIRAWLTGTALPALGAALGTTAGWLEQSGPSWVGALLAAVQTAWPGVRAWFATTALPTLGAALGTTTDWLAGNAATWVAALQGALGTAWESIKAWFTTTALPAAGTALGAMTDWLSGNAPTWVEALKAALATSWETLKAWFSTVGLPALKTTLEVNGATAAAAAAGWVAAIVASLATAWETLKVWATTTGGPGLAAALTGLAETVGGSAGPWVTALVNKLVLGWPDLLAWVSTKGVPLVVVEFAKLVGAVVKAISEHWPEITSWIADNGWKAVVAALAVPVALTQAAGAIVTGILNGMTTVYDASLKPWLDEHISAAAFVAFVGDLSQTLADAGGRLLTGLRDGAETAYTGILKPWFATNLSAGAVAGMVGDLSKALLSAGGDIIQGLIDGIAGKMGDLQTTLGGVTDKIPDWKGPPVKDATLLYPAGSLIMDGLVDGIGSKVGALKESLNATTDAIARHRFVAPAVAGDAGAAGQSGRRPAAGAGYALTGDRQAPANATLGNLRVVVQADGDALGTFILAESLVPLQQARRNLGQAASRRL